MSKFEPKFAIKPLNEVSPGALVIFERKPAFAAIKRTAAHPANQRVSVTLAVHDFKRHTFAYRYFDGEDPKVLVPTGEIVIKPNLYKLSEDVSIQPASDRLFHHGDENFIIVEIPDTEEVRLLSLPSGSLVRPTVTSMDGFDSWEIGVMSLDEFVPLLKVG